MRWTRGLANQIRRSLADGSCSEEVIAQAEGVSVLELRALLARFPAVAAASVPAVAAAAAPRPGTKRARKPKRRRRRRRTNRKPRREVLLMHRMYADGATLDEVGRAHGISHERARQLFVRAKLPVRSKREHWAMRRRAALAAARARADEIVAAWSSGANARTIAKQLELEELRVMEVIEEATNELDRRRRHARLRGHGKPVVATRQRCCAAVKAAAAILDHSPTAEEYGALAAHHPEWPAAVTIAVNWGWHSILVEAGYAPPRTRPRKSRSDRVPPEACWRAVHLVAQEIGRIPTCADYEQAARGRADLPSLTVVRRRLGGWEGVMEAWPGPQPPQERARARAARVQRAPRRADRRLWGAHVRAPRVVERRRRRRARRRFDRTARRVR